MILTLLVLTLSGVARADGEWRGLLAGARTAAAVRDVFARLGDPFFGPAPASVAALVMRDDVRVEGKPLTAARAFQLLSGRARWADGEISAHQLEILEHLAPHVRDFADLVALACAPGHEPFVRARVSRALVSNQLERLRGWTLSPHDWATVVSFWYPEHADPRECRALVAGLKRPRDLGVVLAAAARPDLRRCLERAARRPRCVTKLLTAAGWRVVAD